HCQGSLPGPHHDPALANPPSPPPAVCNGPPINDRTGTYGAGGMQLEVPVKVTLSAYWGVDGVPCTADDTYFFRDAPSTLALTTCSAAADCADADVCNGTEQCQNLTCVAGNPLPCDDGNPCTDDSCDPTAGCVHTNNTGPCDDGNPCTTSDTCQSGTCVGVAGAN